MALHVRGVVYDTGCVPYDGRPSRPTFDPHLVRWELELIARDLRCTAVRVTGSDLDRLTEAAARAIEQGLTVWFSPTVHNADPGELLYLLDEAARRAESLRRRGHLVLLVGWALTLFLRGLIPGDTVDERMAVFTRPWQLVWTTVRRGSYNGKLNAFLARAVPIARRRFGGPLSYASGSWEDVDWTPFTFVSVDGFRDSRNRHAFPTALRAYQRHGKPVVATEFGCATFTGARDRGAMGWSIVDHSAAPPRLAGDYRRDESEQAAELAEVLDVFAAEQLDGAFVHTFASYAYPASSDPRRDLDVAGYGLVSCLPDGTLRPKEAYGLIARRYADLS